MDNEEKKIYTPEHKPEEAHHNKKHGTINTANWSLLAIFAVLILLNQALIMGISDNTGGSAHFSGNGDLSNVDVTQIESTAQGIALLFPVDQIKTTEDAIAVMIPTGTPDYGAAMGVSFDDPVNSLQLMENGYYALKEQAQADAAVWDRYLSLATEPRGISCEFCCGVGAIGVTADGTLRCGCAHNPAAHAVALWLIMNTDYSDAEVLREVYKWKALWFPKDMVGLALEIAGGDTDVLQDLPGMVGGC